MTTRRFFTGMAIAFGLILISPQNGQGAWSSVSRTPYDQQMRPVVRYVHLTGRKGNSASLGEANDIMARIRSYRHDYGSQWQSPRETRSSRCGDCKDKSVLLIAELSQAGGGSLMLVIGDRKPGDSRKHAWVDWKPGDSRKHAWVEWKRGGIVYILDPSFERQAKKASHFPDHYYQGEYAYIGSRKFTRVDTLMAGK